MVRYAYAFEFMDLSVLPGSLRFTLRDLLKCVNSLPFRFYYRWVTREILVLVKKHKIERIVELGAGSAPLTEALAETMPSGIKLIPCDLYPDTMRFNQLKNKYANVSPVYERIDFGKKHAWPEKTLLVLSATFHHIPAKERSAVLRSLSQSSKYVVVFEPLRRTLFSIFACSFALIPGLLLPLLQMHQPNSGRRIFWCWLVPVAPLLFIWDGVISCFRQWTSKEWTNHLSKVEGTSSWFIQEGALVQKISC